MIDAGIRVAYAALFVWGVWVASDLIRSGESGLSVLLAVVFAVWCLMNAFPPRPEEESR